MNEHEDFSLVIGKRAFLISLSILLVLIVLTGIMSIIIPSGTYRQINNEAGQKILVPDSFAYCDKPQYPIWRWFTAPLEVLTADGNTMIITIIVFFLIIAGAVSIMIKSGVLHHAVKKLLERYANQCFKLVRFLILVFMLFGSFLGIFEEAVLFIPLMVSLSLSLNWNKTIGLAISMGSTAMGFSAAITNPFTIGIAQKLAGLSLIDGAPARIIVFIIIYVVYQWYVIRSIKKLEAQNNKREHRDTLCVSANTTTASIQTNSSTQTGMSDTNCTITIVQNAHNQEKALRFLYVCIFIMVLLVVLAPLIPVLSGISFPLIALVFLMAGIGTGLISKLGSKTSLQAFGKGALDVGPGIILVLLAASIKHVMVRTKVLDTLIYFTVSAMQRTQPVVTALLIYLAVLVLNFFISSGSAKAFLIIPIITPIADLSGLSRNMAVLAYIFGDGFSNILFPSNALLLIALGIAGLDYKSWFKWIVPLELIILFVTSLILAAGIGLHW